MRTFRRGRPAGGVVLRCELRQQSPVPVPVGSAFQARRLGETKYVVQRLEVDQLVFYMLRRWSQQALFN